VFTNISILFKLKLDSFEAYLNSCYFVSEQMKSISQINLKDDQEVIRDHYPCTILDVDFYKKFHVPIQRDYELISSKTKVNSIMPSQNISIEKNEDQLENKLFKPEKNLPKRVSLKAIELDWIFKGERASSFLKNLGATDNIEIFKLDIIRDIILFQWKYFERAIILKLFVPYLLYFVLFCVYSTYVLERQYDDNDKGGDFDIASYSIGAAILVFNIFWVYIEVRQMILSGRQYFSFFWNYLDVSSIIMN